MGATTDETRLKHTKTSSVSIFVRFGGWINSHHLPLAAVSDLVVVKMGVAKPSPHAWIATKSGLTPMMFMARVRL